MYCLNDPADVMPLWQPPTPPMDDTEFDAYVECCSGYLYDLDFMTESQLPPIYIERDANKFSRRESIQDINAAAIAEAADLPLSPRPSVTSLQQQQLKQPISAEAGQGIVGSAPRRLGSPISSSASGGGSPHVAVRPPRSLFEVTHHASSYGPTASRYRRDQQKGRSAPYGGPSPPPESAAQQLEGPDWGIHEEYTLLQALQKQQQLTQNLSARGSAAHVANWEFVSVRVSSVSSYYRSPTQCRLRYELLIQPREEGRLSPFDPFARKLKKMAPFTPGEIALYKKKTVRTQQLFQEEGASVVTSMVMHRFSAAVSAYSKRSSFSAKVNSSMPGSGGAGSSSMPTNEKLLKWLDTLDINYNAPHSVFELSDLRETRTKEKQQRLQLQKQQQAAEQRALQQQAQQQQNAYIQQGALQAMSSQVPHLISRTQPAFVASAQRGGQMQGSSLMQVSSSGAAVNLPGVNIVQSRPMSAGPAPYVTSGPGAARVVAPGNMPAVSYAAAGSLHQQRSYTPVSCVTVPGIGSTVQVPNVLVSSSGGMPAQLAIYRQNVAASPGLIRQRITPPSTSGGPRFAPASIVTISAVPQQNLQQPQLDGSVPVGAAQTMSTVELAQQIQFRAVPQGNRPPRIQVHSQSTYQPIGSAVLVPASAVVSMQQNAAQGQLANVMHQPMLQQSVQLPMQGTVRLAGSGQVRLIPTQPAVSRPS